MVTGWNQVILHLFSNDWRSLTWSDLYQSEEILVCLPLHSPIRLVVCILKYIQLRARRSGWIYLGSLDPSKRCLQKLPTCATKVRRHLSIYNSQWAHSELEIQKRIRCKVEGIFLPAKRSHLYYPEWYSPIDIEDGNWDPNCHAQKTVSNFSLKCHSQGTVLSQVHWFQTLFAENWFSLPSYHWIISTIAYAYAFKNNSGDLIVRLLIQ